ncbi:ketopantoate reductase family protein [Rhodococcoides kyotonense]|uniref:2-dehydropantoate 2-reductase n=1 Tax=Rhodococcoides kyotonense TaxID=398843 RepID=A0A239M509_9NOCA|nr:2-dehydropantoate 2-reductase N-terminal domain-containing protein [Rhodococcus kyotonensis]SNT36969.1 2-dehydropantoate 2-reductase [Rhodococcus kyotonensis]
MTADMTTRLPESPQILVVGAGVLGSLYAARLALAGYDVTVSELSEVRRQQIATSGLVVEEIGSNKTDTVHVPVIAGVSADADFDLVIAIIRKTHLDGVIESLAPTKIGTVLFMMSNAEGPSLFAETFGPRAVLGFPGAGGSKEGQLVRYSIPPKFMQQTMLGELDDSKTDRIRSIAEIFRAAGFSVSIPDSLDSWMKSHEAFVSTTGNATYAAGGDGGKLGRDRELLDLNIDAMREIFEAMNKRGIPLTPSYFKLWQRLPKFIIRATFGRFLASSSWQLGTEQLLSMRDEVEMITGELQRFAAAAGVQTPALNKLVERRTTA